jgi:hypothetical protein
MLYCREDQLYQPILVQGLFTLLLVVPQGDIKTQIIFLKYTEVAILWKGWNLTVLTEQTFTKQSTYHMYIYNYYEKVLTLILGAKEKWNDFLRTNKVIIFVAVGNVIFNNLYVHLIRACM